MTLTKAWPYAIAATLFALYTVISDTRHRLFGTTGYDLGIFEQAIRAYAHLRAPVSELKGPGYHLLGDHFHPILALLGPIYRIFPSPVTLLVAQAALLALSAIPITRLAIAVIGPSGGVCLGLAYGLSWGLLRAMGFDFHEICFAVPLLAFSLQGLAQSQWGSATAWALPLVLVKEDLPLTVAAIGGYLMLRGQRRLGMAVAASGLACGLLIVTVVIPAFNPDHAYSYASGVGDAHTLLSGAGTKVQTLLVLLAPTAFLAVRSPLVLIAIPTLAWRFLSSNPNFWGTQYHYSAVLMPIVFIAFIHAVTRFSKRHRLIAVSAAVVVTAIIGLAQLPRHVTIQPPELAGHQPSAVREALNTIPNGVSVAAVNRLAPQLTARCQVYLFPNYPDDSIRPEWIAVTETPDTSLTSAATFTDRLTQLGELGYHLVTKRDGIVLFRRDR
jgi:uncharacterized membrane protein